jgi:hypothetical protein
MSEAAEAKEPPPPELVRDEMPFWKMADVKGLIVRHLVTGYLVTNYRCFIWDVESNVVEVNVPVSLADVTVEGKRGGRGRSEEAASSCPRRPTTSRHPWRARRDRRPLLPSQG